MLKNLSLRTFQLTAEVVFVFHKMYICLCGSVFNELYVKSCSRIFILENICRVISDRKFFSERNFCQDYRFLFTISFKKMFCYFVSIFKLFLLKYGRMLGQYS